MAKQVRLYRRQSRNRLGIRRQRRTVQPGNTAKAGDEQGLRRHQAPQRKVCKISVQMGKRMARQPACPQPAVGAAFGKNGAITPWIAVWLPNVIVAAGGGYLILKEDR